MGEWRFASGLVPRASRPWLLQNKPAKVFIFDDVLEPVLHIVGIDFDVLFREFRPFKENVLQQPLHDREQSARADVFRTIVDLNGRSGNLLQSFRSKFQDQTFRIQQRVVLLDESAAWFGQDSDEIIFGERFQLDANGKATL